jgi:outer membrane protein assembly factor BamB
MQQAPLSPHTQAQSKKLLVLASILLPPLGAFMLWRRSDIETGTKVFASFALVVLSGLYLFLIFRPNIFVSSGPGEAHFSELERHRAEQRAALGQQPADAAAPAPAAPAEGAAAQPSPATGAAAPNGNPRSTYWTDFRGPARDGRYNEMPINTLWPAGGLRQLWKQPVGGGYASFVAAEGAAFTIEQRRGQEVIAAYDIETGRELWTHAYDAEFRESAGGDGPRATPTWHEGRVYSMGAQGDLRVVDAKTGKLVWSKNILSDNGASNLQWGMSASPLIVDDKVVVIPGGPSNKSVVAYNKLTGARVWGALGDKAAYTSPMLVTLGGRRQILAVTESRAVGLTVENGSLLWEFPWTTSFGVNSAQPIIIDANRFIISAGYGHGAAMVEVAASGGGLAARKVWENIFLKNKFNSSVLHNGYLYGLDETILTCIDANTGERKWKGGRYGYGQLLLAGDHLIVTTEDGNIVLVRATPDKHEEVASFQAIEGKTWNHPAIAGGRLLVRNETQMACYDLSGR